MPIRPACPEDFDAIRNCATDAYGKYVARIGKEPAPMIADFRTQIDQGIVHVSSDDSGDIQGFVVFYPKDDHIHLENVAVSGKCQGMGIGRALIAYCEDFARQNGFPAVELYTNEKMTENLPLYAHLGYRETGRRREDGFNRVFFRKAVW